MKLKAGNVPDKLIPQLTQNIVTAVQSGYSRTNVSNLIEDVIQDPNVRNQVLTESFEGWPCKWKG